MKRISKVLVMVLVLAGFLMSSGCASYLVYKDSQKKVAYRHAVAAKNDVAIKAIELGNGGAGIGIDVTALDSLTEQPFMQFMAAILDAGIIYGGYRGVEAASGSSSGKGDTSTTINGDRNTVTVVNGDSSTTTANPDHSSSESAP